MIALTSVSTYRLCRMASSRTKSRHRLGGQHGRQPRPAQAHGPLHDAQLQNANGRCGWAGCRAERTDITPWHLAFYLAISQAPPENRLAAPSHAPCISLYF